MSVDRSQENFCPPEVASPQSRTDINGSVWLRMSTRHLDGDALKYAVADATGLDVQITGKSVWIKETGDYYSPCALELMSHHMLSVKPHVTSNGKVTLWSAGMTWPCDTMPHVSGPTILIAVCRAAVMKMYGSLVWIPAGLVPD